MMEHHIRNGSIKIKYPWRCAAPITVSVHPLLFLWRGVMWKIDALFADAPVINWSASRKEDRKRKRGKCSKIFIIKLTAIWPFSSASYISITSELDIFSNERYKKKRLGRLSVSL
jgi:hypothetical protein